HQNSQLDPAVDVVLQKTTFTFDVSGWEFWWPLLAGCPVVFAEPGGHKDVDYLQKTIREYGVTTLHFVPPMLELFLLKKADLPSLRRVICSGEALTPNQVNTFREQYPEVELHNLYGPTEAAIDVTHWPVPSLAEQPEPITYVPIGKPITNVPIRILGPEGQFRPIGVPGELYLGGIQVARGYLNRPELTAEKFVTLPGGGRWYRTGDLGRWDFDGNIDFLGRIDSQVKLRGFRIELGEIEYALLERPEVSQAVVLVKKDPAGQEHLTAYVVSPEPVDSTELSYYLGQKLPAYMVPTFFVRVDEIPTTPNGKIDRKRLPGPVNPAGIADLADEAPLSEFEQMIHEAWTEVFAHESIGRNVNFLDLGGHSLTGIRLVNRINEAFELELPANTIFRYPTIATLATHVEATIRELLAAMDED
ncbi:MAG: AMP-binding protein, partial [Bacteroidota bacterium]